MKQFASLLGVLALSLGTAAPASAGQSTNQLTITEIVAQSGGAFDTNFFDYDLLLNAVLAAGLDGALADPDVDWTVLAPNDLAFIRLARSLGYGSYDEQGAWLFIVSALTQLGGGDPIPVLTQVLLYHVLPEPIPAYRLFLSPPITTLQGGTLQPFLGFLRDKEPDLRDARIFFPRNIRASNGVIHTINRVMLPIDLP